MGVVATSRRALLPDLGAASAPLDGEAGRHPQTDDHDAPAEDPNGKSTAQSATDLAADNRPGGDQPGHRPRDMVRAMNTTPATRVDGEGQGVLVPLRRWRSSSMKIASRR